MSKKLRDQLIGAWKLVSYEEQPIDGSPPFYPMSEHPMGIIMYTPDGYMSAQLSEPDRKRFAFGRLVQRYGRRVPARKPRRISLTRACSTSLKSADADPLHVHLPVSKLDRANATSRRED